MRKSGKRFLLKAKNWCTANPKHVSIVNMAFAGFSESALRRELATIKNIDLAFLFGSAAAARLRKASDVDVALLLKRFPSPEKRIALRLNIADRLSELTGYEVDVVFLNTAGSVLKYQVAKNGKLLFERQKGMAKRFRLNAIKEYFDYLPTFNFHFARLKARKASHG